jgi:hypothetical protein
MEQKKMNSAKILIVDDDPAVSVAMQMRLRANSL